MDLTRDKCIGSPTLCLQQSHTKHTDPFTVTLLADLTHGSSTLSILVLLSFLFRQEEEHEKLHRDSKIGYSCVVLAAALTLTDQGVITMELDSLKTKGEILFGRSRGFECLPYVVRSYVRRMSKYEHAHFRRLHGIRV